MNNVHIYFHLYESNVDLTYVYISSHQDKLSASSVAVRLNSSSFNREEVGNNKLTINKQIKRKSIEI